jgi:phosphotransferase system enzyme I (PtsP)
MVRSLDLAATKAAMQAWLAQPPRDLRAKLTDWARDHSIDVA